MARVRDKICIVTGAALGIGRTCAAGLGEEGAKLALFDALDAQGEALTNGTRARGFEARYWHVDVSNETQVNAAIDDAARTFGALHALVNNAGISGSTKLDARNQPSGVGSRASGERQRRVLLHQTRDCASEGRRRRHRHFVVDLRFDRCRRCTGLSRLERRGALDEQDRRDDLRAGSDPLEFVAPRLHLNADGLRQH
jgi:NAD(P)-dependent dehydrogenase (short-subunit alcohol dehydrogenase family)